MKPRRRGCDWPVGDHHCGRPFYRMVLLAFACVPLCRKHYDQCKRQAQQQRAAKQRQQAAAAIRAVEPMRGRVTSA